MAREYPPGGALFRNKKKTNEKAPDWRGDVEISKDLLGKLVDMARAKEPIKMQIAGWTRHGQNAGEFISVILSEPYQKEGGGGWDRPSELRDRDGDGRDDRRGGGRNRDDDDLPF